MPSPPSGSEVPRVLETSLRAVSEHASKAQRVATEGVAPKPAECGRVRAGSVSAGKRPLDSAEWSGDVGTWSLWGQVVADEPMEASALCRDRPGGRDLAIVYGMLRAPRARRFSDDPPDPRTRTHPRSMKCAINCISQ